MTIINLSPQAQSHIETMLEHSDMPAVELKLEEQGCNGYKYVWNPTVNTSGDHVVQLSRNRVIVINNDTAKFIAGSEVILGVNRFDKKLTILNPNEMGSCGCGESVNFKQ